MYYHRYTVALLLCSGNIIINGLKMILNALMNNIVYHTYVNLKNGTSKGFCYEERSEKLRNATGVYDWPVDEQTWVMESYNWGYFFGNFPGAYMGEFMSAKWTWFISVSITIACTLVFPVLGTSTYWPHLTTRIVQGFAGGMVYPLTSMMLAEWAPEDEKNTMGSVAFTGCIVGYLLGRVLSTVLSNLVGWQNMYYIMGGASGIWLILWAVLVTDKPSDCKFMSEKERIFIALSNIDILHTNKIYHVRWWNVFTSKPFWALLVMHSSCGTVFNIILKDIPIYMWDVFRMEMQEIITIINSSYAVQCVLSVVLGRILDNLVNRKKITQSWAKKISTLLISAPSWVCLMSLGYVRCNMTVAVSLIAITCVCFGGMNTGYLINHVDIGPKIAGRLMAITNTTATIGAIFAPFLITNIIDEQNRSIITWRIVFWICGGFFIVDMMCYTIWGSAVNQDYYWEENRSLISTEGAMKSPPT